MNSIERSEASRRVSPVERGVKRRVRDDDGRDFAEELAHRLAEEPQAPRSEDENEADDGALPEDRLELSGRDVDGSADTQEPPTPDFEPETGRHIDLKI